MSDVVPQKRCKGTMFFWNSKIFGQISLKNFFVVNLRAEKQTIQGDRRRCLHGVDVCVVVSRHSTAHCIYAYLSMQYLRLFVNAINYDF